MIPYKNPIREKQRQASMDVVKESNQKHHKDRKPKVVSQAWSQQKELKERREVRREKRLRKKEAIGKVKASFPTSSEIVLDTSSKRKAIDDDNISNESLKEDWIELQKEAREMKRNKK